MAGHVAADDLETQGRQARRVVGYGSAYEVFYVEHFVKVEAKIRGFEVSQNGKLLSAAELAGIGDGYFRRWPLSTKVGLTKSNFAPRTPQER